MPQFTYITALAEKTGQEPIAFFLTEVEAIDTPDAYVKGHSKLRQEQAQIDIALETGHYYANDFVLPRTVSVVDSVYRNYVATRHQVETALAKLEVATVRSINSPEPWFREQLQALMQLQNAVATSIEQAKADQGRWMKERFPSQPASTPEVPPWSWGHVVELVEAAKEAAHEMSECHELAEVVDRLRTAVKNVSGS